MKNRDATRRDMTAWKDIGILFLLTSSAWLPALVEWWLGGAP